ncbi:probable long-chain-alcohol O-fatty-acyltransferase 5 [Primulina huaijiensis]|uniref:probable long-chain-alcohol O-fatty-acyltransferase 5 n=1 Tax=Primulina huaijiensis TaxID=1492673 RepID=UPI003CC6F36F
MEDEIKNLCNVSLGVITSLCCCHLISSRLPKGKWRLLSFLPIFFLFATLPLYLTSAFFAAITAFFITWLANFKLLLCAFDQGPLSSNPTKSLPVFIIIAALPFMIKPKKGTPPPQKSKKLPLNLATEIPVFLLMLAVLTDQKEHVHLIILLLGYCCLVFLMVDIIISLSSFWVGILVGLELEPASDEPYLATSLQEFWGRRWNITVSSLLRQVIYKPVRSAAAEVLGRDWAALPAVLAAFLVSGLMHELLFWYITRARPSWETTAFFVLQGVGVVAEFGLKETLDRKKWRLPWLVRSVLTMGFVVGTSFWLFFPPLIRNGADVRVLEEFRFVSEVVKEKLPESLLRIGRRRGWYV